MGCACAWDMCAVVTGLLALLAPAHAHVLTMLLQLATAGAERDSLAQQNAALASALGSKLGADPSSSTDASLAGPVSASMGQAGGVGPRTPAQSETGGAAAAAAGTPTPAQMKEIGVLMQRLTRENASLIKARWADVVLHLRCCAV
jgi:hypothetical protein